MILPVRTCFFVFSFLLWLPTVSWAANRYLDNGDGTLTEPAGGTMWLQADDGRERIWLAANQYCENLEFAGYSDWLLPKIHQLEGLIDLGYSPTIDPLFQVKPSYYWSSSESRNSVKSAKYVNFYYGNTYAYSKDNTYFALCVRDASQARQAELAAAITPKSVQGMPFKVRLTPNITGGSEPYFYEWDFGDGEFSSVAAPEHNFAGKGPYKVILTVSDDEGAIAVDIKELVLPLAEEDLVVVAPVVEAAAAEAELAIDLAAPPAAAPATANPVPAAAPDPAPVVTEELPALAALAAGEPEQTELQANVPPAATTPEAAVAIPAPPAMDSAFESEPPPVEGEETFAELPAGSEPARAMAATRPAAAPDAQAVLAAELPAEARALSEEPATKEQAPGQPALAVTGDAKREAGELGAESQAAPEILAAEAPVGMDPNSGLPESESAVLRPRQTSEVTEPGESTRPSVAAAEPPAASSPELPAAGRGALLEVFAAGRGKAMAAASTGEGLLAYSLVNALKGDADWNKDGQLTAHELRGYLALAVENVSQGQQQPLINLSGADFPLCAAQGQTFVLALGVPATGEQEAQPQAALGAEVVRQALSARCPTVSTSILVGERASRGETLQALQLIKTMITPADNLIFYYSGQSAADQDRLNLFFSDTEAELSAFTGLFYEDLKSFAEKMAAGNVVFLLELAAQ